MQNRPAIVRSFLIIVFLGLAQTLAAAEPAKIHAFRGSVTIQAEDTTLNAGSGRNRRKVNLCKVGKGWLLKEGLESNVDAPSAEPDIVFSVKPAESRALRDSHACGDECEGRRDHAQGRE